MTTYSNGYKPDCEALRVLLPAYSMGLVAQEEAQLIESAFEECPGLKQELAEYDSTMTAMLLDVPQVVPPHTSKTGLLARVAAPHTTSVPPQPSQPSRRPMALGFALVAAALLVITNVWWWSHARYLAAQVSPVVGANLEAGDAVRWVTFEPQATAGREAAVVVIWDVRTNSATLYTEDLPPLASDESYQLWLLQGEERVSAGVFRQDEAGRGVLVFDIPAPLETFTGMGITQEPLAGSPAPTNNPVAVGTL